MSADLISFPLVRRTNDVALLARNVAAMSHDKGEQYLADCMRRAAERLRRTSKRQLPPDVISNEVKQFETAVRVALWRQILLHGGVA